MKNKFDLSEWDIWIDGKPKLNKILEMESRTAKECKIIAAVLIVSAIAFTSLFTYLFDPTNFRYWILFIAVCAWLLTTFLYAVKQFKLLMQLKKFKTELVKENLNECK